MSWYLAPAKTIDLSFIEQAKNYQKTLTKPPGSLGQLEEIAGLFSAWQNTLKPDVSKVEIVIMAADHGVAAENVSAFPQVVTAEMVRNFARGGAAISVLAKHLQARLTVVNLGTIKPLEPLEGVIDKRIADGTENICLTEAMTAKQLEQALAVGKSIAERAYADGAKLFIGGEMGIANTTPAACVIARLLAKYPVQVVGPGSGLGAAEVVHKTQVVERALARHTVSDPVDVLRALGGFEIAGLTGAFIACAQLGLPILLDGYIVTAAALAAVAINPSVNDWLFASHCSAEPAHQMMLESLAKKALIDLQMRLGEGSGAAVAVPLIQAACRLQSEMASFEEAGISTSE